MVLVGGSVVVVVVVTPSTVVVVVLAGVVVVVGSVVVVVVVTPDVGSVWADAPAGTQIATAHTTATALSPNRRTCTPVPQIEPARHPALGLSQDTGHRGRPVPRQTRTVALLLIRHADAGSRHDWDGPDAGRPLNPKGLRQAMGLVDLLGPQPIERVLSSPYARCRQTVEPLGADRGLEVEDATELAEGHSPAATHLARTLIGTATALCSHGDVIPEMLWSLAGQDGFPIPPPSLLRCKKGSTWVLDDDGTRFVAALYLPPPAS